MPRVDVLVTRVDVLVSDMMRVLYNPEKKSKMGFLYNSLLILGKSKLE